MKTLAISRMAVILIPVGLALMLAGFLMTELVVRIALLLIGLAILGSALRGLNRCVNGCQKMIDEA